MKDLCDVTTQDLVVGRAHANEFCMRLCKFEHRIAARPFVFGIIRHVLNLQMYDHALNIHSEVRCRD
jgi:hypothetical protein